MLHVDSSTRLTAPAYHKSIRGCDKRRTAVLSLITFTADLDVHTPLFFGFAHPKVGRFPSRLAQFSESEYLPRSAKL
jgi:hypothetical protein